MQMASLFCILLIVAVSGCITAPELGRTALIGTTAAEENALGEQTYRDVLARAQTSNNERWKAILQRAGERIATVARQPGFQWQFTLLESRERNAFCLPGGKVALSTGIFLLAETEAAVAAILAHEAAHAIARHAGQRMTLVLGR